MLKQPVNNSPGSSWQQVVSFVSIVFLSLVLSSYNTVTVTTITFFSADGLEVTADEYIGSADHPYILLFHEQESSRGEFQEIAQRLCKMDYNCLAVDLRNGGNSAFVSNETAKRCRAVRCNLGISDIELDMLAAMNYTVAKSKKPVILLGSGANGSLCLKMAKENENVKAVIALSPGEYFLPVVNIQSTIENLEKPTLITSSLAEIPYVTQLSSGIPAQFLTLFEPQLGDGGRGTRSLTRENKYNSEYWLAFLLFFKDLI